MVDRMQAALVDKIDRLAAIVGASNPGDARQYQTARKLIKELVVGFNNYELMKLVSKPLICFDCLCEPREFLFRTI